MHLETMQDRT